MIRVIAIFFCIVRTHFVFLGLVDAEAGVRWGFLLSRIIDF